MERRLGNDQTMKQGPVARKAGECLLVAVLTAFVAIAPASAQNYGERTLRYGNTTTGHFFDGRDDHRDFPTDGFFPGNFAADPLYAATGGAAGFLDINPQRSAAPYPSQTYFGFARDRADCRNHRLHDALEVRRCGRGP
jgi:hypothetical protein